jgi:hypothetical protein
MLPIGEIPALFRISFTAHAQASLPLLVPGALKLESLSFAFIAAVYILEGIKVFPLGAPPAGLKGGDGVTPPAAPLLFVIDVPLVYKPFNPTSPINKPLFTV